MATMIYVISDTFFGRHSKAKERGFNNTEEMQVYMIDAWNSKIKETDIVYHLGNFAWDIISAEHALMNLNGIINIMPSTYDSSLLETVEMFDKVSLLHTGIYVIETLDCVLSSWPLKDWPAKRDGVIHIHGGDKRYKAQLQKESRFNSNCDLWNYAPVSMDTLNEVIQMVSKDEKC